MDFFFNELTVHNQFNSEDDFRKAMNQFSSFRKVVTDADFTLYINRTLLDRPVLGKTLVEAIKASFDRQQMKTFMNWLTKSGWFLPDEQYSSDDDVFHCIYPEGDVSKSALAECAFRCLAGETAASVSLENSDYGHSPLQITMQPGNEHVEVKNYFSLASLNKCIAKCLPPITSWSILFKRIKTLPQVSCEGCVEKKLSQQRFNARIANSVWNRLKTLSELASAKSKSEFDKLFAQNISGTLFSDSSKTEKNKFKKQLTFLVNGKRKLCPFHGKVSGQEPFRIHIADSPAYNQPIQIVYIGPKLTKK